MNKTKQLNANNWFIDIFKGTIFSLVISMVLIIIFAIIIRFANISDGLIMPINQGIKAVSLLIGIILALRNSFKGFVKGLLIGFAYAILSYIVFSILSNTLSFGLTSIVDLLFDGLIGAISGMIAVNMGRR